jgi:hypothetical protein
MLRCNLLVVFFALFAGIVFGQVDRANLNGTVTDASGSLVPDARVEIVSQATGLTREAQTGPSGVYSIPGLPIGTYSLKITHSGFSLFEVKSIQLFVGQSRTLDAKLQVGGTTTQVEVVADAAALETSDAQVGNVIESRQLSDIPINGRNWATLQMLSPGAINVGGGDQHSIRFNGRGLDDNNYTFDGIDATGVQEQAQKADARLNISLESIAEFRVNSSNYTAESGSTGGGQVNAVSKSGENNFHGGVFDYLRNDVFDARSPFDPAKIPPFRMNQFGGSLGGPIRKNRTFFFTTYEGIRQSLTSTMIGFVPNAAYRAQVLGASPALKPLLSGWPTGQKPVDSITDQYTSAGVNRVREDSGSVRVDHEFTDNTSMFVRYNIDDAFIDKPFDSVGGRDTEPIRPSNLALQLSHVFSPRIINEVRAGMNRSAFHHLVIGTSPVTVSSVPPFDDVSQNQLDLEVGTTFNYLDNLSIIRGRHTLKFGINVERVRLNNTSFGIGVTTVSYGSADDFIHNVMDSVGVNAELSNGGMRRTLWMGYGQDEFKVRPNLTLNLGLRYEYYSVMHEVKDRIAVVDIACGGFCPAGTPMYAPDRNNFGPRVGLAWTPAGASGRTVIRSGFGVYFSAMQNDDFSAPHESTAARYALSSADVSNLSYPLTPFLGQLQAQGASPKAIDRNRRDIYFENWDLMIQRQLGHSFVGQIGYVGSEGHRLYSYRATNVLDPITKKRPLPQFGQYNMKHNDGNSSFHSLQASVTRSFTKGWLWQTQYMWSHAIADGGVGAGENFYEENVSCFRCDRSDTPFDVRHTMTMNSVYEIPFHGSRRATKMLLGGWSLSGLATASTGRPVNITVTRKASDMPDGNSKYQRPNLVPGVSIYAANQSIGNWFNPKAFTVPTPGTWGNLGRYIARGPGYWEVDTALEKKTPISEKVSLKLRVEEFNLLNHPIFGDPASNISSAASFGQITSVLNTGAVGTGTPRRLQFMLRLEF